ncbi:MAG: inorganic diphosphatase [Candidatus Phytoplasma pyri]
MNLIKNFNPKRITKNKFIAVIEISQGSKKKYEIDKETGMLILDRFLNTAFRYPANYGFIPLTHCEDNDPLDVLVLTQEPLEPMILVECFPIGIIKMIDQNELDEKIIAVSTKDPIMSNYKDIKEIPKNLLSEIKHFFENYKTLENKKCFIENIKGQKEAIEIIEKHLKNYKKNNNKNK